jgi:hypothetical protein
MLQQQLVDFVRGDVLSAFDDQATGYEMEAVLIAIATIAEVLLVTAGCKLIQSAD